jgi:hypothetical protein
MKRISALWGFSRGLRVEGGPGLRPGSGAATLWTFLFLVFLLVGLVLLALGFDLDEVDRWIDRRVDWFDLAGTILFKGLLAAVLLFCVLLGGFALYARIDVMLCGLRRLAGSRRPAAPDDAPGWGSLLVSVVIGYFAAAGLLM